MELWARLLFDSVLFTHTEAGDQETGESLDFAPGRPEETMERGVCPKVDFRWKFQPGKEVT